PGYLRDGDWWMLKISFFWALLIASLVWNIASFISPYKWEYDEDPPRQNRREQSSGQQYKTDSGLHSSTIEIECNPNCTAKNRHDSGDYPGALKRSFLKFLDDPVAQFTFLLFVATLLLVCMVRRQVKDSRAVQRAHVFVLSPHADFQIHDNMIAGMRLW